MTKIEAEDVTAKHKIKVDPHDARSFFTNFVHLCICAAGILGFFFAFGVFQEKIVQGKYNGNDKFTFTQVLVFFVCAASSIFSYFLMGKKVKDTVPKKYYVGCAASYLLAMLSSNQALQYLPYPTQVLAKSCKPIPVMVFGVAFAGKRYELKKYLLVICIVFGVALFMYKDKKTAQAEAGFGWGEILLILSLAFDGTTTSIQDHIKTHFHRTALSMMFYMNFFASIFLTIGLVTTGELLDFLSFLKQYPEILWSLTFFAASSCAGQVGFGTLSLASIDSVFYFQNGARIFTTYMFNHYNNSHPISDRQIFATFIVFACLFIDALDSKKRAR